MAKPAKKAALKKAAAKQVKTAPATEEGQAAPSLPRALLAPTGEVLDRLFAVIQSRRDADPAVSHSARTLSRGNAKVAQKFGEEAVECLIEAVTGNRPALIAESADVLYHLLLVWTAAGLRPDEVWQELQRREGVSGLAEKASRAAKRPAALGTRKIP